MWKLIIALLLITLSPVICNNATITIGVFLYSNSSTINLPSDYVVDDVTQKAIVSGIRIWEQAISDNGGIPVILGQNTSYVKPIITYYSIGADTPTVIARLGFIGYMMFVPGTEYANLKIIVPPAADAATAFMQVCETTHNCLVISPLTSSDTQTKCTTLTAECANKYIGQRRFDYTYQTLPDYTYTLQEFLNWGKSVGLTSISIYHATNAYGTFVSLGTAQVASSLKIAIVEKVAFNITNDAASADDKVAADNYMLGALQKTKDLNPGAIAVVADLGTVEDCKRIIKTLRSLNWLPSAVVFGGGCLQLVAGDPDIKKGDWHKYMFGVLPWDEQVKGVYWQAATAPGNYEPWSSTESENSPQIYADYARQRLGPLTKANLVLMGVGTLNMLFLQKGLEHCTTTTPTIGQLQQAIKLLSQPSIYGQISFDVWGRVIMTPQMVIQMVTGDLYKLITPYSVGEPPVYPMPTFDQRQQDNDSFTSGLEIGITAINALCITALLILLGFIVNYRNHSHIKASTVSFCLLILLGAIIVQSTVWLWPLRGTTTASCISFVALIHVGFGLMFQSMFLKTYRLWKIFGSQTLHITGITTGDLTLWLSIAITIDMLFFMVWNLVSPIVATEIIVDLDRLSLNYTTCTTSMSVFSIITLLYHGCILVCGIVLNWKIRHIPDNFNESLYIGLSIWGGSFVLLVAVPILALDIGDIKFQYIVRSVGIILFCLFTIVPLFWSKVYIVYCDVNNLPYGSNQVTVMKTPQIVVSKKSVLSRGNTLSDGVATVTNKKDSPSAAIVIQQ